MPTSSSEDEESSSMQVITNEIASPKNKMADELVESEVMDEVTLSANQEQPVST